MQWHNILGEIFFHSFSRKQVMSKAAALPNLPTLISNSSTSKYFVQVPHLKFDEKTVFVSREFVKSMSHDGEKKNQKFIGRNKFPFHINRAKELQI